MRVRERSTGAGGDASVDELYRRHAGAAMQVARSITRNADDASDAVAEAFAGVLQAVHQGRLADPGALRAYLMVATRNAAIDVVRRTQRVTPAGEDPTRDRQETLLGPSDRLMAGADRSIVAEAFGELAPSTGAPTTTLAAGAGPAGSPAPFTPRERLTSAPSSLVAHALVADLPVHDTPGSQVAALALTNPRPSGAPLALLVTEQRAGWLRVLLPIRPNGSTGWIRAELATLVTHDFRVVVELGAHRITAYQGQEVLLSEPIGVGTRDAPTPGGLYFITELFQPLDASGRLYTDGPYGPYAYGLSGFSEVLFDFAGGDGQFGIHGTNDPSGLGRDVSHGCIRMSNAGITLLAQTLPLGVPVDILP